MKLTPIQQALAKNAKEIDGAIEERRWKLAKLATEAEELNIPAWAEVIGNACRRSTSTVYEWRKAHVLRKSVLPTSRLSISFWVSAANAITDENYETILDWLDVCEKDETMTIESARDKLPHKKPPKVEPPPPSLREALLAIDAAIEDVIARPDAWKGVSYPMKDAKHFVSIALNEAEALTRAREAAGGR